MCAEKCTQSESIYKHRIESHYDCISQKNNLPDLSENETSIAIGTTVSDSPDMSHRIIESSYAHEGNIGESKVEILKNSFGQIFSKFSLMNSTRISSNHDNIQPVTLPTYLKPFHVRLSEYNAKRDKIFNDPVPSSKQKRSAERIRNFWSNINHTRSRSFVSPTVS